MLERRPNWLQRQIESAQRPGKIGVKLLARGGKRRGGVSLLPMRGDRGPMPVLGQVDASQRGAVARQSRLMNAPMPRRASGSIALQAIDSAASW